MSYSAELMPSPSSGRNTPSKSLLGAPAAVPAAEHIELVADRPGHDFRYAVDAGKIRRELGWAPRRAFADSLRDTVAWYIEHRDWCRRIEQDGHTRQRLGLGRSGDRGEHRAHDQAGMKGPA